MMNFHIEVNNVKIKLRLDQLLTDLNTYKL